MHGKCFRLALLFALSGFSLLVASGCDEPTTVKTPKTKKSKKTKSPEPLPEMDELSVVVDQGRVEFSAPLGWHVPERSDKYLGLTCYRLKIRYPEIALHGEDFLEIESVTDDNLERFAKLRSEALAGEKFKLFKEVKPVHIGSFVGIEYQRLAKVKNKIIARVFLETVVDGRLYSVELRATKSSVGNNIGFGHAFAAALRFPKAGSAVVDEVADDEESSDESGEEDEKPPAEGDSPE